MNQMTQLLSIALLLLPLQVMAANTLQGIRVWAAPESTRIVLDLSAKAKYQHSTLVKPNRLVVDLVGTKLKFDLKKIKNSSKLFKRVRLSKPPKKGTTRIVLDLNQPVKSKLFLLSPTAPYGHRLVVDIEPAAKSKPLIVKQPVRKLRNIIVGIDAGHGGDDPGSIGPSGTYEKKVVFEIANRLKKLIDATPGMTAIMTRKGDYFVKINRRSELARKNKVDLLISIHADAFTSPKPRGASIWVLTKGRAESEMGRWLEQKERHSELLGGAGGIIQNNDSEQYLAMTIIDMVSDKSMASSHVIASQLISEIGQITKLHKKHPELGNFGVLKSPDIPSILVETGFISNPREEKLLRSSAHQKKLAKALHKGVLKYFRKHAPRDTLLANQQHIKHKVVRGDSLTKIALQYQVSVNSIKKANNLKSSVVRIGQKLKIPNS